MKIVILTSDILDGLVISQRIIRSGKDVKAVVFEKRKLRLKALVKRVLFLLKGAISHIGYSGMTRDKAGLEVRGVDNINSDLTKDLLARIGPDLIVVVGTRKLGKDIFGKARIGAINMHSGILPYYRGADSEFWALYNGDLDKIGVSIHFIDERLDSGDIILCARQKVEQDDDHKKLRMKNILLGAEKMVEAIGLVEAGRYTRTKQDEEKAKVYRSASKKDIDDYLSSGR